MFYMIFDLPIAPAVTKIDAVWIAKPLTNQEPGLLESDFKPRDVLDNLALFWRCVIACKRLQRAMASVSLQQ